MIYRVHPSVLREAHAPGWTVFTEFGETAEAAQVPETESAQNYFAFERTARMYFKQSDSARAKGLAEK